MALSDKGLSPLNMPGVAARVVRMAGRMRWRGRTNYAQLPVVLRAPSGVAAKIRHDLERDLHDRVAIGISAMAAHLDLISRVDDAAERAARIARMQDALYHVTDEVRGVGKRIYPPALGADHLASALQAVAEQRGLRLALDLPARSLAVEANARLGLLVADHLNTLFPGTVVHVRVRGRRLVRLRITEDRRANGRRRTYRAWLRCG